MDAVPLSIRCLVSTASLLLDGGARRKYKARARSWKFWRNVFVLAAQWKSCLRGIASTLGVQVACTDKEGEAEKPIGEGCPCR